MPEITIAGFAFPVTDRYAEGHTLSANEAGALNQTFAENLRNNFASKVKAVKAEDGSISDEKLTELQSEFATYAGSYQFGVRLAGAGAATRRDPIEIEARRIAREQVNAALATKGVKIKDLDKEKYEAALDAQAGKEAVLELARKRVAEKQALLSSGGEDILSGLDTPAEEAPAKRSRKAA